MLIQRSSWKIYILFNQKHWNHSLIQDKLNYFKNQWLNGTMWTLAFESQKRVVGLKTKLILYWRRIKCPKKLIFLLTL